MSKEKPTSTFHRVLCPSCGENPCLGAPKCGLKYIANSPSKENGGFHENAIEAAQEALKLLPSLESSNAELKRWKESAIVQLGKADKLHDLLRSIDMTKYWGRDVYDSTIELVEQLRASNLSLREALRKQEQMISEWRSDPEISQRLQELDE